MRRPEAEAGERVHEQGRPQVHQDVEGMIAGRVKATQRVVQGEGEINEDTVR
ncbi:MAG: hypothetical protein RugAbin2_02476, partial [Rugosibacter sp.]|nr:hypothetical protein [Rugosibacter sp.]